MASLPPKWLRALIPGVLVIIWLIFSGIGGPYFGKISGISSNDLATFLPQTAESTKVNDKLLSFYENKTLPLILAFDKQGKTLSDVDVDGLKKLAKNLQNVQQVSGTISPPIVAEDSKAAIIVLPLKSANELKKVFTEIRGEVGDANLALDYKMTGAASFSQDLQKAFSGIDATLLLVALVVVFIILLVVYRSPILPVVVLAAAVGALSSAIFIVWNLANAGVFTINGQVQGILFILVIGATTDYSLLYIARYREELGNYESTWRASLAALRASFEPIIAAGGTVTVGLLVLLLSDLGSNKALGPVGGIGIGMAVASALTFLPSLLLPFGRAAFWPRHPKFETENGADVVSRNHPAWSKVGALVRRHPRRIWITTIVLLLVACVGFFQLKADGVPQSELVVGYSEAREGQKIIDKHFPSGSGSPAYVLLKKEKINAAVDKIDTDKSVASVYVAASNSDSGTMPVGREKSEIQHKILEEVEKERVKQLDSIHAQIAAKMPGAPAQYVESAYQAAIARVPAAITIAESAYPFKNATLKIADGNVLLQVTLKDAADSLAARDTVVRLRNIAHTVDSSSMVGGISAIQYDTNRASEHDRFVLIPMILLAITVILILLLRSFVAPLVLLLTTIVSFGATLGIAAILFNYFWHFPGADPSVILFGFVFLVALGIDYNIFLMTRVREEIIKSGVQSGTIKALVVTGGVITSAGVVLAATFAALSVIPVLFLTEIAFIVAFGVLLDTIVVRSLLVPALTLEIGRPMWWPSKTSKKKKA